MGVKQRLAQLSLGSIPLLNQGSKVVLGLLNPFREVVQGIVQSGNVAPGIGAQEHMIGL